MKAGDGGRRFSYNLAELREASTIHALRLRDNAGNCLLPMLPRADKNVGSRAAMSSLDESMCPYHRLGLNPEQLSVGAQNW